MPKVNIKNNSSRIKVSLDDPTASFLLNSLFAGSGIILDAYTDGSGDQLIRITATGVPAAHATSHENGGADEISVLNLSGLLADAQTPLAHKTSHENGGSDEISIAGLSGVLADRQDADKLYGRNIDSGAPSDNNLLVWNAAGSAWTAENNILFDGAALLWASDGGGSIGASGATRPANIYLTADAYISSGAIRAGALPAGVSNDYGIYTTTNTDTLGLWSVRSSGSGNVSVQIVADVNAAAIDADHKMLSIGWVNNTDTLTEEIYVDGAGNIKWTTDGGGNIGAFGANRVGTIYASNALFTGSYISCGGYLSVSGGFYVQGNSNAPALGLGTNYDSIKTQYVDIPTLIVNSIRTDGANNIVGGTVYDRNAASITNAATMRLHTFGWTNDSDTYNELAAVLANGQILSAEGSLLLGILPTDAPANSFGISTPDVTDTLALISARTSGSGNISHRIIANVNAAAIDTDHKLLVVGWQDDSDVQHDVITIKDDELEIGSESSATLLGGEPDGASVVACTTGSEIDLTSAGAKLHSFVNNSTEEKAAIDYEGNLSIHELDNGQALHFKSLTEELTIAAAAYTDSVLQIPAECQVIAVSTRVITEMPDPCTYDIGVSGATTRYGTSSSGTAGITTHGMNAGVVYYSANAPVRITPTVTPSAATGEIRLTVHYMSIDVPTS